MIELDPNGVFKLDLVSKPALIPGGITIRGSCRGTLPGPLLFDKTVINIDHNAPQVLEIKGENVRITGLRLRGPSAVPDCD